MKRNYRNGFGVVESVLVIVILLILGALTYVYFYKSNNQKTSVMKQQTIIAPKGPDTKVAANLVQSSYAAYTAASDNGLQTSGMEAFEKNTTPALASTLKGWAKGYDPIFCAQNRPASLSYGSPQVLNGDTVVTVTEKWESSSDLNVRVTIDGATNKISMIACPSPQ